MSRGRRSCSRRTSGKRSDYFKLPHAFWLEGWNERLGLPATSVLLIALSLRQAFSLPHERGGEWYGISRDTIRRGVDQLLEHDLITVRVVWRATMRSPTGATEERRYTLAGAFAAKNRRPRSIASAGEVGARVDLSDPSGSGKALP